MLVNVEVTQEIIDRSKPCDSFDCVVSNALNPFLKDGYHASTCAQFTDIRNGRRMEPGSYAISRSMIPESLGLRINEYDSVGTCEPFSFELEVADECLREDPLAGAVKLPKGKVAVLVEIPNDLPPV